MVTKCSECGGDVRKDRNKLVCVRCGFIVEDSPLVGDYVDRRDMEYYQRQLSRPSGCMPVAVKRTYVMEGGKVVVKDGEAVVESRRVVDMYQAKYPLVSAEEQRRYHLEAEISRIGGLLSLCHRDRGEILSNYNTLRKAGLTKNYPLDAVLGAIAGVVMMAKGRRVAPSLLAEAIGAPKKTLKKQYYSYAKELLGNYPSRRLLWGTKVADKWLEKELHEKKGD